MARYQTTFAALACFVTLWLVPATIAAGADDERIIATWQTETGGHVTISNCGNAYCGRVTKVVIPPFIAWRFSKELAQLDGQPVPDYLNSDPSLRNRPIQDLQVLTISPTGQPDTYEGTLYNPEDGNTYSGRVQVLDENHLRVDGCVLRVLCASQQWVRVP
jgi:uncharacterized protein (DUF2147 family)